MEDNIFNWYVKKFRFKVLLALIPLITIVYFVSDGLIWFVLTAPLAFAVYVCIGEVDSDYRKAKEAFQKKKKYEEELEKKKIFEEECKKKKAEQEYEKEKAEQEKAEQERNQKLELERKIELYGDERAIVLFEKQNEIDQYNKPIHKLLKLYKDFDSDPEFRSELNQPYLAINAKAKLDSTNLLFLFSNIDSLYKEFCTESTRLIVSDEMDEKIYLEITKKVEKKIDESIELRAKLEELTTLINKLEKRVR